MPTVPFPSVVRQLTPDNRALLGVAEGTGGDLVLGLLDRTQG